MKITNTDHRIAIACAQDIVIALIMHACATIDDVETTKNLRRSRRELEAAIKRLLKNDNEIIIEKVKL